MTEVMTQERAAEARQGPHGGRRHRDREQSGDASWLHPAEHRAADGGSGDRAAQRRLLRPDRIAAEIHQAPALGESAVAANAGRCRSRQGQDRNAATAPDGKAAQAGAPRGCQCIARRSVRRRVDASVRHGCEVSAATWWSGATSTPWCIKSAPRLAQACTRMADERGEPPLHEQN